MSGVDSFCANPTVVRLGAVVQHYAWGSTDFIPALLGEANPAARPWAELWMGAHPDLPSSVRLDGATRPLDELIAACPDALLGAGDAARFRGELPFLFKVLSAAMPLSIQAHPDRAQAEAGFRREDAAGIPVDAPERNYRDRNHKPELLVALTPFFALCGFRPLEEIVALPERCPEMTAVLADFEPDADALRRLYARLMTLPQASVDGLLAPMLARIGRENAEEPFTPEDPEYWLLEADRQFSRDGHHDRGLFSVWLLNLLRLAPGEGIYLPAGNLHAYLRGTGMELMANSNNVLRGGLTPKHVDVEALLDIVVFEGGEAEILRPLGEGAERTYPTTAAEFELRRIGLAPGSGFETGGGHGIDILIVIEAGEGAGLRIDSAGTSLALARGEIVLVPAGLPFRLESRTPAVLFRATVPRSRP